MNSKPAQWTRQNLAMAVLCLVSLAVFAPRVRPALSLSLQDDRYLPTLIAPLLCLFLLFWDRQQIFSRTRFAFRSGGLLVVLTLLLGWFAARHPLSQDPITAAAPIALSAVLFWIASFLLCYGPQSVLRAIYPLCCLFLTVPAPAAWLDRISAAFQSGSADVSYQILNVIGVPVLREGTTFSIPSLTFNIAPECSGIRSALAFVMVGLLAGRLFLRSGWTRSLLILATIPIAIAKNSVRIVVITSLGAYVDRSFIDGPFHHRYSGLIFAPLDFVLFLPLLIGLAKLEGRLFRRTPKTQAPRRPEQPILPISTSLTPSAGESHRA